jgi:hypothetical protein
MLRAIDKDPDAILPYRFDWTDWLDGDNILNATFAVSPVEPDGLEIEAQSFDSKTCTVWLRGGADGRTYTVTNRIFPDSGAAHGMCDDRSILVRVRNR